MCIPRRCFISRSLYFQLSKDSAPESFSWSEQGGRSESGSGPYREDRESCDRQSSLKSAARSTGNCAAKVEQLGFHSEKDWRARSSREWF
jgi:hypothetical protein